MPLATPITAIPLRAVSAESRPAARCPAAARRAPGAVLFRLDPADHVIPADGVKQRRMIGGYVPPDYLDYLVIAAATGNEPAFAADQLHRYPFLPWSFTKRNARMLA
jgi:hypothetical protein